MRKLASIQKIADVQPIENADKICKYKINNWWVVDAINKYNVNDLVVYFEIDSFLPVSPNYEFLRKTSYRKLVDGTEGFRLKTISFRKQVSQGLIIPINHDIIPLSITEGEDVTDLLNIIKYEPQIPACLAGDAKGYLPSFLNKTDEERCQNIKDDDYDNFKSLGNVFYFSEKLDGSSCSFYLKDDVFGVCSRNLDLVESPDNTFWKIARLKNIEHVLRVHAQKTEQNSIALQGELIGEGVQGNPYKIRGHDFFLFNLYFIDSNLYASIDELIQFSNDYHINHVPIIAKNVPLPDSIDLCLNIAEDKSALNPNTEREGLVIRSFDRSISFKAISNKFLLKSKNDE